MNTPEIDVIIPVFNTGKVLNKCLSSIQYQSFENWKCIIVNDHSSNKETLKIIEKWCKKDPRFISINKAQNEGVDAARFTGISSSNAKYITFVDSDDWLSKDALQLVYQASIKNDADIVIARNRKYYGLGLSRENKTPQKPYEGRIIGHEELLQKYFVSYFGCNILPVNVWATLYTRALVEKASLRPTKLKFGEDLMFNLNLFPYIQRFYAIEDCIYNYNVGFPGAHSGKYMQTWLDNAIKLFEYKWNILEHYDNPELARFQAIEMKNYVGTYLRFCILYDSKHKQENISIAQEAINHAVFNKMKCLYGTKHCDEPLTTSIMRKDADEAYNIMERTIHTSSLKNKLIVKLLQLSYYIRRSFIKLAN